MGDPRDRREQGPAEGAKREAQDRESNGRAQAQSPVDKSHVDAPKQQDNARGHRTVPQRDT